MGHKGCLPQPVFEQLLEYGVQLIIQLMSLSDNLLLRKRAIIESITAN